MATLESRILSFPWTEKVCQTKVRLLMRHFQTQGNKHWFTEDLFLSLLRIRGMECASGTKYAEAFYARKIVCSGRIPGAKLKPC